MEGEVTVLRVVDHRAGDVGRQKVGRELDAVERRTQGGGNGFRQRGLTGSRDVVDQQMAFGKHARERQLNLARLAHDGPRHVGVNRIEALFERLDRRRVGLRGGGLLHGHGLCSCCSRSVCVGGDWGRRVIS